MFPVRNSAGQLTSAKSRSWSQHLLAPQYFFSWLKISTGTEKEGNGAGLHLKPHLQSPHNQQSIWKGPPICNKYLCVQGETLFTQSVGCWGYGLWPQSSFHLHTFIKCVGQAFRTGLIAQPVPHSTYTRHDKRVHCLTHVLGCFWLTLLEVLCPAKDAKTCRDRIL